jgi:two-component system sensor kinase FixL
VINRPQTAQARKSPPLTTGLAAIADWSAKGWNGYGLAVAAVGLALVARLGLESIGRFYYLPLIPAVMLPALLSSRGATALAILLSILANVVLVPRESITDAAVNALLFAAVGVAIGEIGRARRAARTRAEDLRARLTSRDATLQALLEAAAVVSLDADRRIRSISQPACLLFRTNVAEATGRPFENFVDYFDPEIRLADDRQTSVIDQYWLGRRQGGEVFPLGIQIASVADGSDRPDTILTLTDLSLWHASELRNQSLRDQLNQVWRINSLGEMAAILAHELNQPLTAAAGYLQATQSDLTRAGVYADSAGRTLDMAKRQVLRAGDIIRRARDLLAVDARTLEAERLSSIIEDLGPVLQMLAAPADANICIELEDADGEVMADRIQIQQALVNLVRNAVEAVADQPRREVAVRGRALSGARYQISVQDSGPGLKPQEIERIFQPMTTTKTDGMGLGLSVTRTIVERHGGDLRVQASDLGGAAFTFTIARHPEAAA